MTRKYPSSISKITLLRGLRLLDRLWARGLLPKDLERHYFLYWFVVFDGNILKAADAIQVHRNTIQGHFLSLGYSKKSVRLRHAWRSIYQKNSPLSFHKKFLLFYSRLGAKPRLNPDENKALSGLWNTRFPFKTLSTHYLLWAQRSNKSKAWVQKKLEYSPRHRARLLSHAVRINTRDGFWLSPLKPSFSDIHFPRSNNKSRKK